MSLQVFLTPPKGYVSDLIVVGCYCILGDRVLLLKRSPNCYSGDTWCLPGGKLEEGESCIEGAMREFHEEVGMTLVPKDLSHLITFYLDRGDLQYDFTVYHYNFDKEPTLNLRLEEHTEARWVTHEEMHLLPLIHGGSEILSTCLQKRGESTI